MDADAGEHDDRAVSLALCAQELLAHPDYSDYNGVPYILQRDRAAPDLGLPWTPRSASSCANSLCGDPDAGGSSAEARELARSRHRVDDAGTDAS